MEEKDIILTTTDLKEEYEILDTLYVIERLVVYPKEEQVNQVLNIVKERIKRQCSKLDGDAVINCQFFRSGAGETSLSISGTAVKIKSKS